MFLTVESAYFSGATKGAGAPIVFRRPAELCSSTPVVLSAEEWHSSVSLAVMTAALTGNAPAMVFAQRLSPYAWTGGQGKEGE